MASLMVAELGEKLGLEGFGADMFGTVGTAYAGSLYKQLANSSYNLNALKWGEAWQEASSGLLLGSFFGSALARKILPADALEGSIGGSFGSIIGTSWAIGQIGGGAAGMQSMGLLGNFLVPGVGAFVGSLLGTYLGNLFGDDPDPGADFWMFAEKQGEVIVPGVFNYYLYASARDGFPTGTTRDLGQAVLDLSKDYMSNIGAFDMANAHIDNFKLPAIFQSNDPYNLGSNPLIRVLQRMNIDSAGNGSLKFFVNGRKVASAEAMVDGAVTDFLRDAQPIGGDIFLKRAVANSTGNSSFTIASAMATAAEYLRYHENREVINALIASAADTAFAGTWAYVLAGAEGLKLAKTNQSDFNGGLGGFVASLTDAGVAVDFSQVTVSRGTGGKIFVDVIVEDSASIPNYLNLFANGAKITPLKDGAGIRFSFDSNMAGVGYKNLTTSTQVGTSTRYAVNGESDGRDIWIAPDNKSYDFKDTGSHTIHVGDAEIESSDDIIFAGGGADSIQGGTGWDWISGGAGNDTLFGGDQDDTIFGGSGNDLIYGGNQMDYLEGGAGADTICGISPNQNLPPETNATDYAIAGYKTSNAAVNINLKTGKATGGHATGDKLSFIIKLVGSDYNDTLVGDDLPNWLEGGAGADTLDGGKNPSGSPDYASYFYATAGVTASLAKPSINTGDAAGDTYISIEALEGSNFDDILIGDNGSNYLSGNAGDDILVAGLGADSIRGGFGFDTMSYRNLSSGIVINLANWAASSAVVADDVRYNHTQPRSMDIEAYEATNYNDTMLGSALDDILIGRAGHDSMAGGDGSDLLSGDDGNDTLDGQNGNDTLAGGKGNDRLLGSAGTDRLEGGAGNDQLYGGDGDDLLQGGSGADQLDGGKGVDQADYGNAASGVLVDLTKVANNTGDAAGDTYTSIEKISGSNHNDTLRGNASANTLLGSAGNDFLDGYSGNDTLYGGDGDDILRGGAGADRLEGGGGTDRADYGNAASGVLIDLTKASNNSGDAVGDIFVSIEVISGSKYNDTLRGDARSNSLFGGSGDDRLDGYAGNDQLFGESGSDKLYGGDGNDTLQGGAGADYLDGGAGTDQVDYGNAAARVLVDLTKAANNTGDAAGDTFVSIEVIAGSKYNDILRGDAARNTLIGREGNDRLDGYAGNDLLYGDAGNDTLYGGDGNDALQGGAGADHLDGGVGIDQVDYGRAASGVRVDFTNIASNTGDAAGDTFTSIENILGSNYNDILRGDSGNNVLSGRGGNDQLYGEAGNDTLYGGDGNDSLQGGTGADKLDGGAGIDLVYYGNAAKAVTVDLGNAINNRGDSAGDTYVSIEGVSGSNYHDVLRGNAAGNILFGKSGNDFLDGLAGNDSLYGGDGDDQLKGGDGNDILDGGKGSDYYLGGKGVDTFVFQTGSGKDTIGDYTDGYDKIKFSTAGMKFSDLHISQYNSGGKTGVLVDYGSATDTILLESTALKVADLTASDFIFT
ncbi:calcium-binding protein [Paenirhodobacter sp.]|uniref:calcium-binding protein n=1 Tax=Paenirhodobacter sp. TaxID=1965326 RepID=UPI003B3CC346